MKTVKKIVIALLTLLCLCACTGNSDTKEPAKEIIHDIKDVTFYNQSIKNPYIRSYVTIYKEGDFEMIEYGENGYDIIRGNWIQRDNQYDLIPHNESQENKKIVFHAVSDEELVLDVDLKLSMNGDSFVREELLPKVEEKYPMVYYNTDKGPDGNIGGCLKLFEDGSFSLTESYKNKVTTINGRYGREGNVYMFSNFSSFNDINGYDVSNFEFFVGEYDMLILNEDLSFNPMGSVFTRTGELPEELLAQYNNGADTPITFTHSYMPDVNEEYYPYIQISSWGEFVFVENVYAGMSQFSGYYEVTDKGYHFYCDNMSSMQGFAGQDVSEFELIDDGANGYAIDTDICMTRKGDTFYIVSSK